MKQKRMKVSLLSFTRWQRWGWAAFKTIGRTVNIGVLSLGMFFGGYMVQEVAAQNSFADEIADSATLRELEVITQRAYPARGSVMPGALYERHSMQNMPLTTVEGALRLNPSVDVRERGGRGIQADYSLYGGSCDQTMVMLNGIDFSDARTGHQSHSLPVDLEIVNRITLVGGVPGTGALSGALNIVTNPERERYLRAGLSAGDFGYQKMSLTGGTVQERASALFSGSYCKSDGYIANTDFTNFNLFGYSSFDLSGEGYDAGLFDLQAGYQKRGFGSNGFYSLKYPWQWEQTETMLASLRWRRNVGRRWALAAYGSYRRNHDRFDLFRTGSEAPDWYASPNFHLTDNVGAGVKADYRWRGGTTGAGVDFTYNHIYSNVLGLPMSSPKRVTGEVGAWYTREHDRGITNYWMRHIAQPLRRLTADASLNVAHSRYGTHLMWSAGADWRPAEGWSCYLNAAQSMRLPTFTDLFYTAADHIANSDLSPERAVTLRAGAGYTRGHFTAGGSLFHRWGRHLIDWVKEQPDAKWESRQLTTMNTAGLDLSATLQYRRGLLRRAQMAYGLVHSDKSSGGYISRYALDYMRQKFIATADLSPLRGMALNVTASWFDRNGSYYDAAGALHSYPCYWVVDVRLSQDYKMLRFNIDANNLLNERYFDFGGLMQPPRWFAAGVAVLL